MQLELPLLTLLIWLPIIGGIVTLAVGDREPWGARSMALLFSVLTFLLSIPLYTWFDPTTADMQFQEFSPWISAFNANYHLGVDGISMPLILLTTFTTVLVVIAGCAHSGICNTVEQAKRVTGVDKVRAVLGGFHLQEAKPERLAPTADYLAALDLEGLWCCHCTDLAAKISLAAKCPVREVGSGMKLVF